MPSEARDLKPYALLAYCFILCIIPLIRKKKDPFVYFHARQGLALFLCEMAVFIISIVFPFLMQPALFVFGVFSLWGMLQVLRAEQAPLPFIHALSLKIDI
jgi:fumarate reductase subunit D